MFFSDSLLGYSRARFYREQRALTGTPQVPVLVPKAQPGSARRLSEEERALLLNLLLSERFVDASPRQVYARLLQEGAYHASYRTRYRLLHEHQAVCERRKIRRHPAYAKPELKASGSASTWCTSCSSKPVTSTTSRPTNSRSMRIAAAP